MGLYSEAFGMKTGIRYVVTPALQTCQTNLWKSGEINCEKINFGNDHIRDHQNKCQDTKSGIFRTQCYITRHHKAIRQTDILEQWAYKVGLQIPLQKTELIGRSTNTEQLKTKRDHLSMKFKIPGRIHRSE